MSVAAYTLRIREQAGDDSRWHHARIVAASLAHALDEAQQRYGVDRVMAIAQDTPGESPTAAELAGDGVLPVVPEPVPDPRIVHTHDLGPDLRTDAPVIAVADAGRPPPRTRPVPWEGRWRPSNLIWIGAAAGLLAFTFWYQFGGPASARFVTAAPATAPKNPGLALGDTAPRGGVLAATGVPLRRGDDRLALGTMVGEAVAEVMVDRQESDPPTYETDVLDDPAVRTIGSLVGEMFARWPNHDADRPDRPVRPDAQAPPNRVPQRYRNTQPYREPPPYRYADARTGEFAGQPGPALPAPPTRRESSVLQPFYVGVDRGNGIMETLRVPAYDADHARAIVADLPERPIIVRGPTSRLDW